ncbi:MAG: PqqD family peptide modification chaperone [Thermodesulfovibrionia bacterium]|nr:PqqD family peptide modification chaperone [Thermodesulfovibrionia bacterium]
MAKACCGTERDDRIQQYQLDNWKVNETVFKTFKPDDTLYSTEYIIKEKEGIQLLIDPQSPNWISVNRTGLEILKLCNGKHTVSDIKRIMSERYPDNDKINSEVSDFISAAGTLQFISEKPVVKPAYKGRAKAIAPGKLDELWIYTTLACNLRCKHCLVSAGAKLKDELSTEEVKKLVDDAVALGVNRFYVTGGEPFIKDDIFEVIEYITKTKDRELILLTNATLFDDEKIKKLDKLKGPKLIMQVSLEGPNAEIHDKLRGEGSFDKAVDGVKRLVAIGIIPIISTAISKYNEDNIKETSEFLSKLGIKDHHILWMHSKGRGASNVDELYVPSEKVTSIMKEQRKVFQEQDVIVDNEESLKARIRYKRGRKNDLCNNCYEKICVNADGHVYPCGSLNGDPAFDSGSIRDKSLKDIWLGSDMMKCGRENTVQDKDGCRDCYLKFFCGGGCTSHSYYASEVDSGKGSIKAQDPYCSTYKALYEDIMWDMAAEGVAPEKKDGYVTPHVFNAMDSKLPPYLANAVTSIDDKTEVGCYHCSCVLSVDVEDEENVCRPEIKGDVARKVKKKYGEAADTPELNYYCPTGYNPDDLKHIPNKVLDVSYGCGNPAAISELKENETVLDLGSGGGIDCFIAAKRVGKNGKVIGVDMTDAMLDTARENAKAVADNLGYDVVEFRKGDLASLPAEDNTIDLVISNCVVNLTEDKTDVFKEVFRILKPGGRFVISDIIADQPVPGYMKRDKELWGACLSGALTDKRFVEVAVEAGFPDVTITQNYLYKKVEYITFYSVTLKGKKPQSQGTKCSCCA